MVSSVLVLFTGDAGEAPSRTTDCGEEGKTISGSEGALWVCEEGMFRMEIKARHASRDKVSTGWLMKPMCVGLGNWGNLRFL